MCKITKKHQRGRKQTKKPHSKRLSRYTPCPSHEWTWRLKLKNRIRAVARKRAAVVRAAWAELLEKTLAKTSVCNTHRPLQCGTPPQSAEEHLLFQFPLALLPSA